jgi:integrase
MEAEPVSCSNGRIQRLRWEHLIERDGAVWVSGGIGKDGEKIEVPMQSRAVTAIASLRQVKGFVIKERGLEWAKRINWWMKGLGWQTEKKLHELRAYVGSMIYQVSPVQAMRFMRHKSIRVTEQFYCRYGKNQKPVYVL